MRLWMLLLWIEETHDCGKCEFWEMGLMCLLKVSLGDMRRWFHAKRSVKLTGLRRYRNKECPICLTLRGVDYVLGDEYEGEIDETSTFRAESG